MPRFRDLITREAIAAFAALWLCCTSPVRADDVGLLDARFTELDGPAYVLEADVPPVMVAAR